MIATPYFSRSFPCTVCNVQCMSMEFVGSALNGNIVYQIYLSCEVHEINKKKIHFGFLCTVHRIMIN